MRRFFLHGLIIFSVLAFLAKLAQLQLADDSYEILSNNIAIKKVYDYPERGYIFDRNGKLIVTNQPSYDIMVIPKDVKDIDVEELCTLLKIKKADYDA
ncbi:MAG: penicillin-binding protein 2, partial [Flavobacteriaceae bacterium]|nr:penicillin-binding protein 2 [Flavobacteriaceae bacterium]